MFATVLGSSQDRPIFKGRRSGLSPGGGAEFVAIFAARHSGCSRGFSGVLPRPLCPTGGCTRLCGHNGKGSFSGGSPLSAEAGAPRQEVRQVRQLPRLPARDLANADSVRVY